MLCFEERCSATNLIEKTQQITILIVAAVLCFICSIVAKKEFIYLPRKQENIL